MMVWNTNILDIIEKVIEIMQFFNKIIKKWVVLFVIRRNDMYFSD